MPSLANSFAGGMSTTTWATARAQVAEVVGGREDPDAERAAQDQITAVLRDWNTRRNWQFLQVKADPIAVTAGTSVYDLPAKFKKPYSAIFNLAALRYVTRREYNRLEPSQTPSTPYFYTLYNTAETGQIELIPANMISGTLDVWYYRLMTEGPASLNDTLDVLDRFTDFVLDAAKARLLALRGPTDKLPFWQQAASDGLLVAIGDDEQIPDEDAGFTPYRALVGVPPLNSFRWVDWGGW